MLHLRATLSPSDLEGKVTARLVPFGHEIRHDGRTVSFEAGGVRIPDELIPVNLEHGDHPLERIGKATELREEDGALVVDFEISDTQAGRDVKALLSDGVLTDVSAGILLDDTKGTIRTGVLDHVSIVGRGAFHDAGSQVLSIHSEQTEGGSEMSQTEATTDGGTTEPGNELELEVADLRRQVTELAAPITTEPRPAFSDKRDFVLCLTAAQRGDGESISRMAEFVLSDDTTTTAAGLVPAFLSSEIISILDTSRPYLETITRDPIGSAGMEVQFPRVTSKPTVDVQTDEKTEVASSPTAIDLLTVPLVTYAGASDVSLQLIERSQPSFVDQLFRELASVYAQRTGGDAVDAANAGATGQEVVADLGADASATFAAVAAANQNIISLVRRPATHWALGGDRWAELTSLTDSDGRPLLVFPNNGPMNAQGQASFTSLAGQYHGLVAFLDVNGDPTESTVYNSDLFSAYVEQTPAQLRAAVVSLLGVELGVWALFAHVIKQAGAAVAINAA